MVVCPSTLEWKRSSYLDLNGEAVIDDDDDGGPTALPLMNCVEEQSLCSILELLELLMLLMNCVEEQSLCSILTIAHIKCLTDMHCG
ncbi:hypothetical protein CRYUN_Cryun01aG0181400 [Craigia yunnanensis]